MHHVAGLLGPAAALGAAGMDPLVFKLLGAAIGPPDWCELLLGRRIAKARALIDGIGRFPDAQVAFCLLRSCSRWAKVLYSCRTVSPRCAACRPPLPLIPTFARPSAASLAPLSLTTIGA